VLFQLSYSADAVAYLPEYIYEFAAGDFSVFSSFYNVQALRSAGATFSESMYLSVVCSEYAAFTSRAAISAGEVGYDPSVVSALTSAPLLDLCAVWNVPAVDVVERAPASGAVPTLVLSGAYDPVTPPAWTELAASTLGAAFYLPFAAQAHGAFADPCGAGLLNRFWSNPQSNPEAACPTRSAPLEFYVAPGRLPAGASLVRLDVAPLVGLPQKVVNRLRHPIR